LSIYHIYVMIKELFQTKTMTGPEFTRKVILPLTFLAGSLLLVASNVLAQPASTACQQFFKMLAQPNARTLSFPGNKTFDLSPLDPPYKISDTFGFMTANGECAVGTGQTGFGMATIAEAQSGHGNHITDFVVVP
jgi:hypothetical protein